MTGDKASFTTLKRDKDGSITFYNNNSSKVLGKGTMELGNGASLANNALLVENMRHNLLCISQMCDKSHTLKFNYRECEIRKEGSCKTVATSIRTPNKIYILDNVMKEKCCFGKIDECWIWKKAMGHVNFKNLIKVRKEHDVRNMPELTNPLNANYKHCQPGKQSRVEFKTKEYSTIKHIELIHTDLCGPMIKKGMNVKV